MRSIRDLPIQQKLLLSSAGASIVALCLACAGFFTYDIITYREATLERLATVSQVIASNSTAALIFEDPKSATTTLGAVDAEPRIVSACIYTADGNAFAEYHREGAEARCRPWERHPSGRWAEGNDMLVAVPILFHEEKVGTLVTRSRPIGLRERLMRHASLVLLIGLPAGLVAFLLASRLQAFISAPVLRLVEMSKRVSAEKDYTTRAATEGGDELGLLSRSFNEMLEQIQARESELQHHRTRLEEEVQLRTAELVSAVSDLESEVDLRRAAEERIRFLAYYDELTQLPNRQFVKEHLARVLKDAAADRRPVALLLLDLDRFKEINDSYGHTIGDELLQAVAKRFMNCVRGTDHLLRMVSGDEETALSRQGGDEFTVLLTRIRHAEDASRVALRLLESLEQPFHIGKVEVVVSASIGIAISPFDGEDADTLIKHADTAMYHAKESGRNDYQYFTESMKVAAVKRLTLEADLRKAITNGDLYLHYQPKVDLTNGTITGVEALMRWKHAERGMVPPDVFIPVAEDLGLIRPMGEWVLRTACRQSKLWEEQGLAPIPVAVNVSSRQFDKTTLVQIVRDALEETALDPRLLELEITESATMRDEDNAIATLCRLKELGIRVSLDDFGTGYSSLSYVRRFPIDALKIDRSFITDIVENREIASIVTAVIAMAHSLGLKAVAEGVETVGEMAFLRERGCDEFQGYLFSPAVAPETLAELVRNDGARQLVLGEPPLPTTSVT